MVAFGGWVGLKQFPCCLPTPTATVLRTATIVPTTTVPPTPPPTSVLVQNERQSVSTQENDVLFHNNVKKGDLLIVAITQFERTLAGVKDVKDSEGDAFTEIDSSLADAADKQDYIELFYAPNANGGPTKVMVTFSTVSDPANNGDTNVGIYEFSGLSTVSPLDDHASSQGTSSTRNNQANPVNMRKLTTSENNEMCFAAGVDGGPIDQNTADDTTVTPGNYYTFPPPDWQGQPDQQEDWNGGERFYTEYAAPVAQGGCEPNFMIHYSAPWAMIGASFKP